jgi:hypothetical protein
MSFESQAVPPTKASFSAAISGLVVANAGTDFFTIQGATGRRIIVDRFSISGIATAAAAVALTLVKRSAVDTGGTSTILTAVNTDSANTTAAAATVRAYTVNPAALGTAVGMIGAARIILSTATASVGASPAEFNFDRMYHRPPVLNDTTEQLCLNFGGATVAGNAVDLMIAWTEEAISP